MKKLIFLYLSATLLASPLVTRVYAEQSKSNSKESEASTPLVEVVPASPLINEIGNSENFTDFQPNPDKIKNKDKEDEEKYLVPEKKTLEPRPRRISLISRKPTNIRLNNINSIILIMKTKT